MEIDPLWVEVEEGRRCTATMGRERFPELKWDSFKHLAFAMATPPTTASRRGGRAIKTYLVDEVAQVAAGSIAAQEDVDPRWLEVEAGRRHSTATALKRIGISRESGHLGRRQKVVDHLNRLPFEMARKPKTGKQGPCDVKTFAAADVDALAARLVADPGYDAKPVDPLWLDVEAGRRHTQTTATERYPKLHSKSFDDLAFVIARKPAIGKKGRPANVKTYLAADVDAIVARAPDYEPVDPLWLDVEADVDAVAAERAPKRPRLSVPEPEAEPVQGDVTFDPLETAAALVRLAARLRNERSGP